MRSKIVLLATFSLLQPSLSAQSVTVCSPAAPCIQVCTGSVTTCKYVPLSSIAPIITIGTVTTLPSGSRATATITGTAPNFVLSLGIPQGGNGTDGANGTPGQAATIAVGQVTTLPPGSPATVSNSGTANAAIFDIGIPQGQPGKDGQIPSGLTFTGKTMTWGDGTSGWIFSLNNSGTKYSCTPVPGAMTCAVQ